jgi:hypothetical protein
MDFSLLVLSIVSFDKKSFAVIYFRFSFWNGRQSLHICSAAFASRTFLCWIISRSSFVWILHLTFKIFFYYFIFIRIRSNSRIGGQIKRVGPDIIEDLLRGKKNPVQCLNEYCSMTKKTIIYTETGSGYRYANYATIDDVQFPQVKKRTWLVYDKY